VEAPVDEMEHDSTITNMGKTIAHPSKLQQKHSGRSTKSSDLGLQPDLSVRDGVVI
jgi:hypothetical protein